MGALETKHYESTKTRFNDRKQRGEIRGIPADICIFPEKIRISSCV